MTQNPYDSHAQGLAELQAEVTGSVLYGAAQTPINANVGIFRQQQVLDPKGGGFKPMTMATVVIRKADVPQGTTFKTYQPLYVQGYNSKQYACKIFSITDLFTSYVLTVWDLNQNA